MTQPLSSTKAGGLVMPNTVNAPREVIVSIANQIREQAECSEFNLVQSGSNPGAARIALGNFYRIANQLSDMLAAAPKAEHVSDPYKLETQWIKHFRTQPAPASDELLEALEQLVADYESEGVTGPLMNCLRDLIARHKGPQS